MPYEKDENEIGALWEKTGGRGTFLSGQIELDGSVIRIVCFRTNSTSDKAPAWRVLKAKPKD